MSGSLPGGYPLVDEPDMLIEQVPQAGLLAQFQHRDQARVRHEILFVEHRAVRGPGMRSLH